MAEYVKREYAVDAVLDVYCDTPDINLSCEKFEAAILKIPAADVAPVVRCNVCVNYNTYNCSSGFGWCENLGIGVHDSFFCKVGERKEGAKNE